MTKCDMNIPNWPYEKVKILLFYLFANKLITNKKLIKVVKIGYWFHFQHLQFLWTIQLLY
jgi:hypothetical protein